jgi:hypothetical protein
VKIFRCGFVIAVAYAIINVAAADTENTEAVPNTRLDPGFLAGPVKIIPGGFLELTGIYRTRNEAADIGSSFSGIPFPNNNNYNTAEFRETSRNSRFSVLAQGPSDDPNKVEGYLETDFVSAGATSNSNESNSYTLRVRQLFLNWSRPDLGWAATAGQAWSLATMYKHGLAPRQEDIPLVDEGQYVTGFTWTRQPQLRLVKTFASSVALGLSLESPQNVVKGIAPSGTIAATTGGSGFNSATNYSTDIAPDAIVKLAFDPGFGHYELYSLTRFLHDRAPSIPGALSSEGDHTTVAESVGGGFILPLWGHWLDLHATTLIGHGNGRYGSAQLGDSTYNPHDGSISPLRQDQALVGLIGHPTKTLDFFAYGGYEEQKAEYGLIPADNTACDTHFVDVDSLPKTAGCGGVGTVRHVAGGFLWKLYQGRLGYIHAGPEIEYVKDTTYTARNGTLGRTNDTMVYLTVRYFPFQ